MIVYLNGRFVPEAEAVVSVFDRSFLYGDGVFETIGVQDGRPFLMAEHLERFALGARLLRIAPPEPAAQLSLAAAKLLELNQADNAILRIQLTRGVGRRGYSVQGTDSPRIVMTAHPAAPLGEMMLRWKVHVASFRLPTEDPLASVKTCNKLPQIMARTEAELAGADEALLLNTDGLAAEGATSNLFWVEQGGVRTPPLTAGALAGVTRRFIMDLCRELGLDCREAPLPAAEIMAKDGLFLTMSSLGVVEVESVGGTEVGGSPVTRAVWEACRTAMAGE
jgi:aminodeoxychorismate lyase